MNVLLKTLLVLTPALAALPSVALAHPLLDQAEESYQNADFEKTVEILEQAEAADDFTREDVLELFLRRALVFFAMGDEVGMRDSLRTLATIEPEYEMPRRVPPNLRKVFDVERQRFEALRAKATHEAVPGAVRVMVDVADSGGVVRAIRVTSRVGAGPWKTDEGRRVDVQATPGSRVEYYVEVVGPGGAVLIQEGSKEEPRSHTVEVPAQPDPVLGGGQPKDEGGSPWPWIGVSAGVVAAAAAVAVYFFAVRDDYSRETDFDPPTIRGL